MLCSVTVSMHELTKGIFSWMCLEKRVVKST